MALGAYGEISDIQPEIWLNCLSLLGFQCSMCGKHITDQTYPFALMVAVYRALITYEGQPTTCHSFNEPGHLKTACPYRRRERAESRPATPASWVEVAATGPISNTTTIVNRATDTAASENIDAWTLQAPYSAPTPQKDERGQRGVEAAPAM